MKITLGQLGVMQEVRRRAVMERFLAGTPRPKANAKPVTATALERATKEVASELERAVQNMSRQMVDVLMFGTAVTKIDANGRRTRADPRRLRYGRKPFLILWRWRRNPKPVYGRGPAMDAFEDVNGLMGLQQRMLSPREPPNTGTEITTLQWDQRTREITE